MEHRVKSPGAVKDFTVDWAAQYLQPGETIDTSDWDVPEGLTQVGIDTKDDTSTTVRLGGGSTLRTFYSVFNTITTNLGRSETQEFLLEVVID